MTVSSRARPSLTEPWFYVNRTWPEPLVEIPFPVPVVGPGCHVTQPAQRAGRGGGLPLLAHTPRERRMLSCEDGMLGPAAVTMSPGGTRRISETPTHCGAPDTTLESSTSKLLLKLGNKYLYCLTISQELLNTLRTSLGWSGD